MSEDKDPLVEVEDEVEDEEDEQDAPAVYEAPAPTVARPGGPIYTRGPGGKLIVSSD